MAEEKTTVMRVLEQKKIPYTPHSYPHNEGEAVDGATVASILGRDPGEVYKTLVTRGASKANYVFVVPVLSELDLKKAAKTVGEKSIEMIHVKELTPLTGYVPGRLFPHWHEEAAQNRHRRLRPGPRRHSGECRQDRLPGGALSRCPGGAHRRPLCRRGEGR